MSEAVFVSVAAAVALPLAVGSALAARCNARQFVAARRTPPLDGVDVAGASVVPLAPPRPWPAFEDVTDPQDAAAYASLADDRAITGVLLGEMLVVVGSAATGAAIPNVLRSLVALAPFLGGVFVALSGAALRMRAGRVWRPVVDGYHDRYVALTTEPLPDRPRRRGLLSALFRR